jgi:hypothetical protein
MPHALAGHTAPRDLVQFAMDERNQPLASRLVAFSPFEKERGDIRGVLSNPDILVACPRQLCSEFRSAAPGRQGATTENTGNI